MIDVKKIADTADVIVNGYAFTSSDGKYKILNLNRILCYRMYACSC